MLSPPVHFDTRRNIRWFPVLVWILFLFSSADSFAGYSAYTVPYFDDGIGFSTEAILELDEGLILVEQDGLRYCKRTENGYAETWTNKDTGIQVSPGKVQVEGNRVYFLYTDAARLIYGKVLERNGDALIEVGTIDVSSIRGTTIYDQNKFRDFVVRDGVVYVTWTRTYDSDPLCYIFEEENAVWKIVAEIDFGVPHPSDFWDMITVVGSGDARSLFFARRSRTNCGPDIYCYDMDRYVPGPEGWILAQTITVEVENSSRRYDAVVAPSGESFLVANFYGDTAARIQVFSASEDSWHYDGYLDLPDVNPDPFGLFGSDSGYLLIYERSVGRLNVLRHVSGRWQILTTGPVPVWDGRRFISDLFLGRAKIMVFNPLREPFSESDYKVALLSAENLQLFINRTWFSGASLTGPNGEWHPALGYYGTVPDNSGECAWIHSPEYGWLYTKSKDATAFPAWSGRIQSWVFVDNLHSDPVYNQPFLYTFDKGDFVWWTDLSTRFFSVKRRDWVSSFDATVYTNSAEAVKGLLSGWDWELSGEEPSLYRSKVTLGSNNDWSQELYVYSENQFFTFNLDGSWGVRRQPDGYLSEIKITIHVDRVDVFSKDGTVSFDVERAWTEYDLVLPEQYILDVSFETLDTGRTTGTILFNSGETEPLEPFDFPYEDPQPRG